MAINNKYKLGNLYTLKPSRGNKIKFNTLAHFCREYNLNYSLLHRKIAEFGHHTVTGVGTFSKTEPRKLNIEEQQLMKLISQQDIGFQLVYPNGTCIAQKRNGDIIRMNFRNPQVKKLN